ncbi:hypothetical protein C3L33_03278, partial [Rhododendron williamsianum]
MNLALPMKDSKDRFVRADEVEKRVSELMDSQEGKSVRMQVSKMKAAAEAAMSEGGSSRVAFKCLGSSAKQESTNGLGNESQMRRLNGSDFTPACMFA